MSNDTVEILLFDRSAVKNCELDDGKGGSGSLETHLAYLRDFGGTPDCWESVECEVEDIPEVVGWFTGNYILVNSATFEVLNQGGE